MRLLIPFWLILGTAGAAGGGRSGPDPTVRPTSSGGKSVIRGSAFYRERIMMPPGCTLRVQLIDNRLADTSAAVIADRRFDLDHGPPYAFELAYEPGRVRPDTDYGLHASLTDPDGVLRFVTDTRVMVMPGSPEVVEFRLVRATTPSSGGPE